jgi:hypothetical protein
MTMSNGGYVKARNKEGWFELITGKSKLTFKRDALDCVPSVKCFGFVQTVDPNPKRRLFEVLKAQGMTQNQQVIFLSDGGETVRNLQLYLSPNAEHALDWFHITMRLTVLGQYLKGVKQYDPDQGKEMEAPWRASSGTYYGTAMPSEPYKRLKTSDGERNLLKLTTPNLVNLPALSKSFRRTSITMSISS